ncbi:ABC transporter permease [Spiroplasma sp. DGKH1]|uniref:ABC transporter permease n=1 Tax=Spiroplasma sp. DGKH1 TaxID=3050074 RepID=UPI0034C64F13
MSGFKLLFQNNIKNTIKNKIQFIGLVILVFLTCLIFTIIEVSKQRVENVYHNFISEKMSNQHDFVVDFSQTSYVENTASGADQFLAISDIEVRQNAILDYLQTATMNSDYQFNFDRVEARVFNLGNNKVIKAVTLNPHQTIDKFVVSAGMPLSFYQQYLNSLNNETMHWVYLTPEFAKKNNIKINDVIRLQADSYGTTIKVADSELQPVDLSPYQKEDINKWLPKSPYANQNWFRVVGFGQSADFITPIIDQSHPFPNMKNEGLAYVDQKLFGLVNDTVRDANNQSYDITRLDITKQVLTPASQSDREVYYVGKFTNNYRDEVKESLINNTLNPYLNSKRGATIGLHAYYSKTLTGDTPVLTFRTDKRYPFAKRTTYFLTTLNGFITGSYILIAVILIISFFVLVLVIKRQIEATGPQNGILRALGYRRREIISSYLSYPLLIALAGGIVGYLLGISSQLIIRIIFGAYFNLPYTGFALAPWALVISFIAVFALLTGVTMISATIMMHSKTPLQLIKKEESFSAGRIKQIVQRICTVHKTFDNRFQAVQFSNSLGKMFGVSLTMIISTILITISTTIPFILQNNIRYSYAGDDYNTLVEYQAPVYNLPTTFLKTYDPTQQPWDINNSALSDTNMTRNADQYIKDFEQATINPENYSPTYNATEMRSMLYKNISKEFLKSNKLTVPAGDQYLSRAVCMSTWGDYKDYGLGNLTKATLETYLANPDTAKQHINELEQYRLFYWKYRETIALDVKRPQYFINNNLNLDDSLNSELFTKSDYQKTFGSSSTMIVLDNNHFRPGLEAPLKTSFRKVLDSGNAQDFNANLKKPMYDLYDWIYSFFINNVSQCFTQGVYTRSPQAVRTEMAAAFKEHSKSFNLAFGVVPFNPHTDDRGTMFHGQVNNINVDVYGIDESFNNQTLSDGKNTLNNKLFTNSNNIVINQTLAKRLGLATGDQITIKVLRQALFKNSVNGYQDAQQILNSWDESQVTGTDSSGQTVGKLLFNGTNNYQNVVLGEKGNNKVLDSALNPSDPNATNPTILNNKIVDGSYLLGNDNSDQVFNIVGVNNQYGSARAWINNERANAILGYDQTRNHLLRLFMNEWQNSFVKSLPTLSAPYQTALSALETFITNNQSTPINQLWTAFVNNFQKQTLAVNWIKVFENEYPLFNYKLSKSETTDDLQSGLATVQSFGDYSFYGLNGGTVGTTVYPPYSESSFNNLLPIATAKAILQNLAQAVLGVIAFIIAISFILSFMIIILTSNVVIAENRTIIATMKVLGYSNRYITKLVIGMYIPVIVIMTIAGFGFGWLFLTIGINVLTNMGMVFPLMMNAAIPIIAIASGFVLYLIAYLISWFNMNKINPLVAIMSAN